MQSKGIFMAVPVMYQISLLEVGAYMYTVEEKAPVHGLNCCT